jgi:hypothetical protein
MEYGDDLDRVLKLARKQGDPRVPVTVADMHSSLRFTRLGAHLRKTANEGGSDDISSLARAALLSDHDNVLDLMPLHMLRDATIENPDHPLSQAFNWGKLPEKVALDEAVRVALQGARRNALDRGVTPISERHLQLSQLSPEEYRQVASVHNSVLPQHSDLPEIEIENSAWRLGQAHRRMQGDGYNPNRAVKAHDDLATDTYIEQSPFLHHTNNPDRY